MMKKDYMLTLNVIEGGGWRPREGSVAVVEARLDGNLVATDPVPLNTSQPKFNTELEWQAHHDTIRGYKLNRQPIRVECLSIGNEGTSQLLGYIIIALASAVPNVYNEPRWHKLLGGPLESHKSPPGLLMAINLTQINKQEPVQNVTEQISSKKYKNNKTLKSASTKATDNEVITDSECISNYDHEVPKESNIKDNSNSVLPASTGEASAINVEDSNDSYDILDSDYVQNISKSQESLKLTSEVRKENDEENCLRNTPNFETENISPENSHSGESVQESNRADEFLPKLNEDGSYFIIGSGNDSDTEEFTFAVTIVFAKNLQQMLNIENIGEICFSYSLLGFNVQTEMISDPSHPEFLAERAAAKIKATTANIYEYFATNPYLPVKLVAGDLCLAVANIALNQLNTIQNQELVVEEGAYQLIPTAGQNVNNSIDMAVVGVYIQLSRTLESYKDQPTVTTHPFHHIVPPLNITNEDTYNSVLDSLGKEGTEKEDFEINNSTTDFPNQGEHIAIYGISSFDNKNNNYFKQKHKEERQGLYRNEISGYRQDLLEEAALDLEKWKEEQQHLFWKQWSKREMQLQCHLSSEWHNKTIAMERKYQERLKLCDQLNEHLNAALSQLHKRQEKVDAKETELNKQENKLSLQFEKKMFETKAIKENEKEEIELIKKRLNEEKRMRNEIEKTFIIAEKESEDREHTLRQMIRQTTEELKDAQLELKSKNEQTSYKREFEKSQSDLYKCIERKQYYKAQWVRAVSDLHSQLKVNHYSTSDKSKNSHRQTCPTHSRSNLPDKNIVLNERNESNEYNRNINSDSLNTEGKETELERLLAVRTSLLEGPNTSSSMSLQEVENRIRQLVNTEEKLV